MTPIPELHPTITVALAESPKDRPMQVVSRLFIAELISEADYEAWDALTKGGTRKILKPKVEHHDFEPRPKRTYVNREARCASRAIGFHGRYIRRRQSLAPTLECRLSAGCVRTLNYIVAHRGREEPHPTPAGIYIARKSLPALIEALQAAEREASQ